MASKHTYLSHTADIAFDVEADSLEELFTEAFKGWLNSVIELNTMSATSLTEINLEADSLEELLVDLLNEANFLLTVKKVLCVEVVKMKIDEEKYCMNALLKSMKINSNTKLKEEIKSVTYHQMEIKKHNGKYNVRVVFDI